MATACSPLRTASLAGAATPARVKLQVVKLPCTPLAVVELVAGMASKSSTIFLIEPSALTSKEMMPSCSAMLSSSIWLIELPQVRRLGCVVLVSLVTPAVPGKGSLALPPLALPARSTT
mgnify:CR=1 FL=1